MQALPPLYFSARQAPNPHSIRDQNKRGGGLTRTAQYAIPKGQQPLALASTLGTDAARRGGRGDRFEITLKGEDVVVTTDIAPEPNQSELPPHRQQSSRG